MALGPDLARSAAWEGLKVLLSCVIPKRWEAGPAATTRTELVTPLPTGKVIVTIDAADEATAHQALAVYSKALKRAAKAAERERGVLVWTPGAEGAAGTWKSLDR